MPTARHLFISTFHSSRHASILRFHKMAPIQFDLIRAEEITKYQFHEKRLLSEALQSATKDRDELTDEIHESDGNRRLAKLGVVVLELAVVDEWFRRGMSHRT